MKATTSKSLRLLMGGVLAACMLCIAGMVATVAPTHAYAGEGLSLTEGGYVNDFVMTEYTANANDYVGKTFSASNPAEQKWVIKNNASSDRDMLVEFRVDKFDTNMTKTAYLDWALNGGYTNIGVLRANTDQSWTLAPGESITLMVGADSVSGWNPSAYLEYSAFLFVMPVDPEPGYLPGTTVYDCTAYASSESNYIIGGTVPAGFVGGVEFWGKSGYKHVYDTATGEELPVLKGYNDYLCFPAWSKTYKIIAVDKELTPEQAMGAAARSDCKTFTAMASSKVYARYFGDISASQSAPYYDRVKVTCNDNGYGWDKYEVYFDGTKVKTVTDPSSAASYTKTGLKPNTAHKVKVVAYKAIDGKMLKKSYTLSDITTPKFKKASLRGTAFSKNHARLYITNPKTQNPKGLTTIKVYMGSKCVKTFTSSGKSLYKIDVKATGAGSAKYKVKTICAKKTSVYQMSAVKSMRTNKITANPSRSLSSYKYGEYFKLTSMYYSGSTLIIKGIVVNNRAITLHNYKLKLMPYANGTSFMTRTFNTGTCSPYSVRNVTFKLSKAPLRDLREGSCGVTYNESCNEGVW